MAEFVHGCGLSYWAPYSRVIRSTSSTGPEGPYEFDEEVVGTFAHNPTVVYSKADNLYILIHSGCPITVPNGCSSPGPFTCGQARQILVKAESVPGHLQICETGRFMDKSCRGMRTEHGIQIPPTLDLSPFGLPMIIQIRCSWHTAVVPGIAATNWNK